VIDINTKIDKILIAISKITNKEFKSSIKNQKIFRKKSTNLLLNNDSESSKDILNANKYNIDINCVNILPESLAKKYNTIVINQKDNILIVAMSDISNFTAINDIELYTNMEIKPIQLSNQEISKLLNKYYNIKSSTNALESLSEYNPINNSGQIEKETSLKVISEPIVKMINSIIEQAIINKASDIHIEPMKESIRIRFRINGDLKNWMNLSREDHSRIVTRIKVMGKMNIAEKRLSQDGRIETIINNKKIDMRISTLPIVYGEKIVIRLLDRDNFDFTKESLGFDEYNLNLFNQILKQPHGMILVTGPTGSGKTTTLYTVLKEFNQMENNIITIEDPVEYKLDGINQVQINDKSGLNFYTGLRSILRQDPDIIMIGEIRDIDTAKISIRASITGHLVLSTLHTNDSVSAITRLIDMGIAPYLIASSITGVISQRLVKVLCCQCKTKYEANYDQKLLLKLNPDNKVFLYKAKGCQDCHEGYIGRTAIYEVMPMIEDIKKLIEYKPDNNSIRKCAITNGMHTLLDSAINLAIDGIISYEELTRVGFTLE